MARPASKRTSSKTLFFPVAGRKETSMKRPPIIDLVLFVAPSSGVRARFKSGRATIHVDGVWRNGRPHPLLTLEVALSRRKCLDFLCQVVVHEGLSLLARLKIMEGMDIAEKSASRPASPLPR